MKFGSTLLLAALALCVSGPLIQSYAVHSRTGRQVTPIYITHVSVIDVQTGQELRDQTVVISGDRIADVKNSQKIKPVAGAKIVDGGRKYLIPGLWDMHVHAVRTERIGTMFPMLVAGSTGRCNTPLIG